MLLFHCCGLGGSVSIGFRGLLISNGSLQQYLVLVVSIWGLSAIQAEGGWLLELLCGEEVFWPICATVALQWKPTLSCCRYVSRFRSNIIL